MRIKIERPMIFQIDKLDYFLKILKELLDA